VGDAANRRQKGGAPAKEHTMTSRLISLVRHAAALGALAGLGALMAPAAHAGVAWQVSIPGPVGVVLGNVPPAAYPAPVYSGYPVVSYPAPVYTPPRVVYAPPQVVYSPPPVYAPAPVYAPRMATYPAPVAAPGWGHHHHRPHGWGGHGGYRY